ncbi:hypothetical protein [Streptomyces showdoensis]|uniref:RHIM domain-containing protein n=1 Tax=Streptomyces showdoensis TaxID=68268 RepID=A0A2P2GJ06_STREW|nr:hypothetical protein [Streptomyces showdoensis]KKZ70815.1 hypothetical protein VO63_27075 [Streptomyces showdoensis]
MTGVELILAALATGAAAGVSESAGTAVRDAYAGLREVLRRRSAADSADGASGADGDAETRELLEAEEVEPGVWEARMRGRLLETGADRDERVLAAARLLLERADASGARQVRYEVSADQAKGLQIGDHNTQTNHFS